MKIKEAAEALGVHTMTIRRMIDDGRLKASKEGKEWEIDEISLAPYVSEKINQAKRDAYFFAAKNAITKNIQRQIDDSLHDVRQFAEWMVETIDGGGSGQELDITLDRLIEVAQRAKELRTALKVVFNANISQDEGTGAILDDEEGFDLDEY